jgi:hypothetical protein
MHGVDASEGVKLGSGETRFNRATKFIFPAIIFKLPPTASAFPQKMTRPEVPYR